MLFFIEIAQQSYHYHFDKSRRERCAEEHTFFKLTGKRKKFLFFAIRKKKIFFFH